MGTKRKECAKCKHEYGELQIRKCPYSKSGLYVCVYCCKACPYVEKLKNGWICIYKSDENLTNFKNQSTQ